MMQWIYVEERMTTLELLRKYFMYLSVKHLAPVACNNKYGIEQIKKHIFREKDICILKLKREKESLQSKCKLEQDMLSPETKKKKKKGRSPDVFPENARTL